jgi:hypothetical protein
MYVTQLPRWLACDKFEREIGGLFSNELMMTMRRTAMPKHLLEFFVNFSRHETHDNLHVGICTRRISRTCYFLFDLFYLVCFRFIRNYFGRGGHFRNFTKAIIRNLPWYLCINRSPQSGSRISGIMASVVATSGVDCGTDYAIYISLFPQNIYH